MEAAKEKLELRNCKSEAHMDSRIASSSARTVAPRFYIGSKCAKLGPLFDAKKLVPSPSALEVPNGANAWS